MKFTKITEQNIHLIAHRLKKVIKGGIKSQHFYPSNKKINAVYSYFNIKGIYEIKESMISEFNTTIIEIDNLFGDFFIRIKNKPSYNYDYKATVVRVGDYISIHRNEIYLKTKLFIQDSKCIHKISIFIND